LEKDFFHGAKKLKVTMKIKINSKSFLQTKKERGREKRERTIII
jgi:hypothetical protein